MGLEPNDFISVMKYRERSTLATRSSPSRPAPKLDNIFTQKRNLHTNSEGTESQGETLKTENRKVYRNSHGEEIIFSQSDSPPGHVFVPSGNTFITRSCRKLAQKLYAVYRPKNRKRLTTQIGLYVLRDVFKKAKSDFKAKRARIHEDLWLVLDKKYPQIPPTDRNELHRLISSQRPRLTGKSALDHSKITIYAYVRDRYTSFKSLAPYGENQDAEEITRAHQRVQEILVSWRGED